MKIHNLSSNPNSPCFLIYHQNTSILLDSSLSFESLQYFVPIPPVGSPDLKLKAIPELASALRLFQNQSHIYVGGDTKFVIPELETIDTSTIDVILISNFYHMLGLPYITQYTDFDGLIYATEPVLQIGRLFMEELVSYAGISKIDPSDISMLSHFSELSSLKDHPDINLWRSIYTAEDISLCLQKVQLVGLNETLDLFSRIRAVPVSSGHSIGSCNWVLSTDSDKIVYVSASSALTTHPRTLEQTPLRDADVLLLASLTQAPTSDPDRMLTDFVQRTEVVLKQGGSVLVPVRSAGLVYDLFECLAAHLNTVGLHTVPLYFLSPIADSSLAYSNIFAEWLSQNKQFKMYLPEDPFPHGELIRAGRLKHFASIHGKFSEEFRSPSVIFTGHYSLRFGPIVHFLNWWKHSTQHALIFTGLFARGRRIRARRHSI